MYDIVIIGAGVSGAATARELSRFRARICVIERGEDVCCGTSKANSGIVHAGFDAPEGSLMARLNVRGNQMMEVLSRELDFPFRRNGALVVCRDEQMLPALETLRQRGVQNGVTGLCILNREEVHSMEPALADDVCGALFAPASGIVCPFELNIAMAENAAVNGVEFHMNTEAEDIRRTEDGYEVLTNMGPLRTKCVVNAAGVYADRFHNMVSETPLHITPRRGEYCLLDKTTGSLVSHTIFPLPDRDGKGILVTPTVHGNLLTGPTAEDIPDKEGICTTAEGLSRVMERAALHVKGIPFREVITSFAGLRACEDGHDFVIGEPADAPGFVDCAGIASPGLSASPAIGEMIAELLRKRLNLEPNPEFIPYRKGIPRLSSLPFEERNRLIRGNPAYGNIICRCEEVSEGEIIDAIRRPLGARSLDGVKRRVRAGMGRCQGGFCSPKVMEILARELRTGMDEITKAGPGSAVLKGRNMEWL